MENKTGLQNMTKKKDSLSQDYRNVLEVNLFGFSIFL